MCIMACKDQRWQNKNASLYSLTVIGSFSQHEYIYIKNAYQILDLGQNRLNTIILDNFSFELGPQEDMKLIKYVLQL